MLIQFNKIGPSYTSRGRIYYDGVVRRYGLSLLSPLHLMGICRVSWGISPYIDGILPKGPYLLCVSMAGRALLTGYHRYIRHALPTIIDSTGHQNISMKGTGHLGCTMLPRCYQIAKDLMYLFRIGLNYVWQTSTSLGGWRYCYDVLGFETSA